MNSANAAGPDNEASVLETFTEYVNARITLRDVSGRVGRPWLVAAILLAYAISEERWM